MIGALLLGSGVSSAQAGMEIGKAAPPMVITGLDGQTFDLRAFRGNVVLVNFWATWCVPCRKEMPQLSAFYRRHHDEGLILIGVSVDRPTYREQVRKMASGFSFPAAMLSELQNAFDPSDGVPSTFVVDRSGVVRDRFIAIDEPLLSKVVIPLRKFGRRDDTRETFVTGCPMDMESWYWATLDTKASSVTVSPTERAFFATPRAFSKASGRAAASTAATE